MRSRLTLPVVLVALAALAACAPTGATSPLPSATSGLVTVRGVVTAGPTCPVVRASPASACADRPVTGAHLLVLDAGGTQVAALTSGSAGDFVLELPPGDYRLVPQPVAGLVGTAPTLRFTVGERASGTPLAVMYDTGIR